ncbi:MAG: 50S ribosomal protein L3 [Opitutales bacterium]|nr:50S ribosomal protein L3 [Opitutales bacterium]
MEKKRDILLVGKKIGMTQVYNESSDLVPVTVIKAEKCVISRVKTLESDGYTAVQFGFGEKKIKHSTKAEIGQNGMFKNFTPYVFHELRVDSTDGYEVGEVTPLAEFAKGDIIDVVGETKGHGFAGVMKRHGFHGGPAAHGSMFHRRGGSYGQRQWVGHVFKGRKMPGHFGYDRCTIQNLSIINIDLENGLMLIKGSVPGAKNSFIVVRRAIKSK